MTALLSEAASLMLTGMLFVFAFLALLIGGIKLIALFCEKYPGEVQQLTPVTKKPQTTKANSEIVDDNVLAAITAAVHQHRHVRR